MTTTSRRRLDQRTSLALATLLFAGSGATSLALEIVWIRWFRLVLGSSAYAVSTVVATFLAGLALGAWVAARRPDRSPGAALRAYGKLEIGIAATALLVPLGIGLLHGPFAIAYRALVGSPLILGSVTAAIAAPLMLPATMLMGATLPILAGGLARGAVVPTGPAGEERAPSARAIALLYGANTLGAAAGAFVAGFVALPALGLRLTAGLAVAGDLALAAGAFALARRVGEGGSEPAAPAPAPAPAPAAASGSRDGGAALAPLVLVVALAGVSSLGLQVGWSRAFAVLLGSTTYAVTIVLTGFILGLGAGALAFGCWGGRGGDAGRARRQLGLVVGAAGFTALTVVPLADRVPWMIATIVEGESFLGRQALTLLAVLGILLVPTAFAGAVLPAAIAAARPLVGSAGRVTGALYGASTVGSIVGSLATGFVLLPWLGIQRSLGVSAAVAVAVGIVVLARAPRPLEDGEGAPENPLRVPQRGWELAIVAFLALGAIVFAPTWDRTRFTSGAYYYGRAALATPDPGGDAPDDAPDAAVGDRPAGADETLFYAEGASAVVAVTRARSGVLSLRINGKADASTGDHDLPTQLLLGHVPMLLHGSAERVCVIGLGSGMTLGAVRLHPSVEAVDLIEIAPEVIDAVRREEWGAVNNDALADAGTGGAPPRGALRVLGADGRQHLALSDARYDVIVSEPSNPSIAGIANVFTVEAFEAMRQRLAPGGVACQWLQGYRIGDEGFRRVLRGFVGTFPHVGLFEGWPGGDYLLVGSDAPLVATDRAIARALRGDAVRRDLARLGIHDPLGLLFYHVASGEELRAFAGDGPVHDDDGQWLEFEAGRSVAPGREGDRLDQLAELRAVGARGPLPIAGATTHVRQPLLAHARGMVLRVLAADRDEAPTLATLAADAAALDTALFLLPGQHVASALRAEVARRRVLLLADGSRPELLTEELEVLARLEPELGSVRRTLAVRWATAGRAEDALAEMRALAASASDAEAADLARDVGRALAIAGLMDEAVAPLREAVARRPDDGEALALLAGALVEAGRPAEAAEPLRALATMRPADASVRRDLGSVLLRAGDADAVDEAIAAFEKAHELDPASAEAAVALAYLFEERGDARKTRTWVERALARQPGDPDLRARHALALHAAGESDAAEEELLRLLEEDPDDIRARDALDRIRGER